MGCTNSNMPVVLSPSPPPPPPSVAPHLVHVHVKEESDDYSSGSDCIYIGTDQANETVKLENELEEYRGLAPQNTINVVENREKYAHFFDNWSPIPENLDEEGNDSGPSRPLSHQLTMNEIDTRAREAPSTCASSFENLKNYLLNGVVGHENEGKLTVRAIVIWLGEQNPDDFADRTPSRDTPEGFLSLLSKKQSLFVTFFTVLCREFGLKCVKVPGVSKAGDYQPGDGINDGSSDKDHRDTWATVFIDKRWEIVHPYWVCKSLVGFKAGGWIKLEDHGKSVLKKVKESVGVLRKAFKEYYIFPDPQEFVHRCHPDEDKWQLSKTPIDRKSFFQMPYLFPTFFGLGLKMVSKKSCLLKSTDGEVIIEIQAPIKNANTIDLWYELYLKDGKEEIGENIKGFLEAENIPKLVAMLRCGDVWRFKISLPIKGTFKLCCYGGPHKSTLSRIAEFRIDNHAPKKHFHILPFNPGRVGFGPGPAATEANLFTPSHSDGLVSIQPKTKLEITFTTIKRVFENKSIVALLHNNDQDSKDLERHVRVEMIRKTSMVVIQTEVPREGEYALTIYSCQKQESINVCNYLLSTVVSKPERANQKIARRRLHDALSQIEVGPIFDNTVEDFNKALEYCFKQKINKNDSDIVSTMA